MSRSRADRTPVRIDPTSSEGDSLWELFPLMVDILPEASQGDVAIRHFELTEEDATQAELPL